MSMSRRLSDSIRRLSTIWATLAALAVFVLFSALALPRQAATAETYAGEVGSPDTRGFYSAEDLYDIAEAYGETGRRLYVRSRFTFDVVWPLVYALFLTTAISWVYARAFSPDSRWQLANLAPLLGAGFDYLENAALSLVMVRYPSRTPVVDTLAPAITVMKWLFVGGSFLLLTIGIAVGAWRWLASRKRTAQ